MYDGECRPGQSPMKESGAELRFGVSDPRGVVGSPSVRIGSRVIPLWTVSPGASVPVACGTSGRSSSWMSTGTSG